ncbi:putative cofD-like protein [Motilibacter rhizosphaerae]|uniref:Putative gluconeogenesis factor n=1 Tax=Motilibacter rhizosphaerae TaxID=598652 RepID=A0A4Q7NFZ9_9ACTN|nr:uridine diphosphate-N-acetylglucosamine-binding protein YvcK [Motilibacter rhizosphaerae]RZS82821.1 putative cofD-like protein [Motilibacter rhizosphaerae]
MTPAEERPGAEGPAVVALGGGHGLAASLSALRRVTGSLTAVVTVADDGGSSGRLRGELGVLPPGDLRQALAALCGDDEWGRTWAEVVQHRFVSSGELHGHALGNLLIVALWERLGGDIVAALDWMGRLLGVQGRVLPMAEVPLDIAATVRGADPARPDDVTVVRGQVASATTAGQVLGIRLTPERPPACPQAVEAISAADWVVLGPGSWFTSVLPHLQVPGLARALQDTGARRLLCLNLAAQEGETSGYTAEAHVEVLLAHAPGLRLDVVLADPGSVGDADALRSVVSSAGGRLVLAPVAADGAPDRHDPERLARAYASVFAEERRRDAGSSQETGQGPEQGRAQWR